VRPYSFASVVENPPTMAFIQTLCLYCISLSHCI